MRATTFTITRADGRSNTRVIVDHVKGGQPGQLYTYVELCNALAAGTTTSYTTARVQSCVRQANITLLREQQRELHAVKGLGYRMAEARDHQRLALDRKHRADVQLHRGVETLKHVRWDELDANARLAHEGTLMIMAALYENQRVLNRRQQGIETVISRLTQRLDPPAE